MQDDPYDLNRFILAQGPHWTQVQAELRAGRKRTHWMWFIFPQLAGLGLSQMSHHFGIKSRAEAEAYLDHPILAERLIEATRLVNASSGVTTQEIFGAPDYLKFHSCMTLFRRVSSEALFNEALAKFYAGTDDTETLRLLSEK